MACIEYSYAVCLYGYLQACLNGFMHIDQLACTYAVHKCLHADRQTDRCIHVKHVATKTCMSKHIPRTYTDQSIDNVACSYDTKTDLFQRNKTDKHLPKYTHIRRHVAQDMCLSMWCMLLPSIAPHVRHACRYVHVGVCVCVCVHVCMCTCMHVRMYV